jgi:dTDP-4-amino-4,6-dideoxygalactose transaminase
MTSGVTLSLPLVDLAALHRELGGELELAVLEVVRSQRFVGGPVVSTFEEQFASYLGADTVVAVANGTDALELALRAAMVEPGAEVLVPANTFIGSAAAVVAAGAVPRFVDVDERSGLIDLDSAEQQICSRTQALMPVHLYGRMADMRAVRELASRHGLIVIEDAAQAAGARCAEGFAGAIGEIGCFSFYPGKNLGAFGDAGAVVTSDPALADRLRLLRDHGQRGHGNHETIGRNSRMDPIQAAVLTVKLAHLDDFNERRRRAAGWYRELLAEHLPDWQADDPRSDVHHLLPILSEDRDWLADELAAAGVQTGIHYPQTVPQTGAFAAHVGSHPRAERRARLQLSLPMHPHLTRADVELIAGIVQSFSPAARESY